MCGGVIEWMVVRCGGVVKCLNGWWCVVVDWIVGVGWLRGWWSGMVGWGG